MEDFESKKIVKVMREGANSEFWQIIKSSIQESLDILEKNLIQDLPEFADILAEECKIEILTYNAKKKYLTKLLDTPKNIAAEYMPEVTEEEDFDVYDKPEKFMPNN